VNTHFSEARQAIQDGAKEIDTVLPLGLLLSNPPQYSSVFDHLKTITAAAAPVPVKVILETSLIPTLLLKIAASVISAEAGASFIKTSTGFAWGGANKDDVSLMYNAVKYKGDVKVKASGGIRSFKACQEMFRAGAERIGTCVQFEFVHRCFTGFSVHLVSLSCNIVVLSLTTITDIILSKFKLEFDAIYAKLA